ncbi:molecular chaperone HtpG [Iodobacter fluviatilis]|uniref:Chaperone protein HtpG n=1 Tax=Iodobacter fluviatilis TaxID=537 RepID=A0A377Q3Y5_9NEIS|nr:molecular chaperone HtpG [Iodobacter fluviatilis]TCU90510.1 molecular chaperone HtpG [Iodobacter fluviatilis]STQ89537.1 High temperature protein G [Iodobacter fluviatilis]
MAKETLGFQTEVKQLLQLMIHSLYSNKEIFLRELISNASDACDKLRFEALNDASLYGEDSELKISLSFDKEARTLTLSDNGIGMSRDEVVKNIGTIARSGTKEFFGKLSGDAQKDANLIGQFGVGFYSAFIVADKVTLTSRRAGETTATQWESAGDGEFTLEEVAKEGRGTEIVLHLKEGEDEYLSDWSLRSIIRKYSDHITLPIFMPKTAGYDDEGNITPAEGVEAVNQASALWARPKSEISDEQYTEFYKHVSHDFEAPLAWSHARVEGKQEYTELLYIPQRAPFDMHDRERRHGIKLYVRRVFIMEDAEKLLPQYLRFVRGLIDSSNLPLNVSREILQHSKDIEQIKQGCVKKVLGLLESMANSDDAAEQAKYVTFWEQFGRVMKEGVAEDFANKDRIAGLLRFASSHTDSADQNVSLAAYVGRMKEGQDKIYFITADSFAAAKNSPHLEVFRKKGIEVLLMSERVDEWMISGLTEFDGKKLQSVTKGELDLSQFENEEEKQQQEAAASELKDVLDKVKAVLGDKVKDVRVTNRLTDSPACIVVENQDMSANLERLLKSAGQDVKGSKPILEINPEHMLVKKLKAELEGERFGDWTELLFDQAQLAEGAQLDDPATFVKRLNSLMMSVAA